jgi:Cu2+-exporting ATPase
LAVPAVQTVASGVLFRNDILLKDGAALEKLAAIDTVVFDKTGTLTLGRPMLLNVQEVGTHALSLAAGLASASRHPLSRAVCAAAERAGVAAAAATNVEEHPGEGLSGQIDGKPVRLGSRVWAGIEAETDGADTEFVLAHDGRRTVFTFADELRGDAVAAIDALKAGGIAVAILSGDREAAVASAARALGIETWQAAMTPQQKLAHVESLRAAGHKVLMVGDGINDAPALAAGFTSMAPSSASDIGQTAADTVFMGDGLSALLKARDIAIRANRLMRQNFALAIGYNVFAVPVAMLGHATPLVAAIAMSTSSMIVVANALRLDVWRPRRPPSNPAAARHHKEVMA